MVQVITSRDKSDDFKRKEITIAMEVRWYFWRQTQSLLKADILCAIYTSYISMINGCDNGFTDSSSLGAGTSIQKPHSHRHRTRIKECRRGSSSVVCKSTSTQQISTCFLLTDVEFVTTQDHRAACTLYKKMQIFLKGLIRATWVPYRHAFSDQLHQRHDFVAVRIAVVWAWAVSLVRFDRQRADYQPGPKNGKEMFNIGLS
jgi:hypothetical protein